MAPIAQPKNSIEFASHARYPRPQTKSNCKKHKEDKEKVRRLWQDSNWIFTLMNKSQLNWNQRNALAKAQAMNEPIEYLHPLWARENERKWGKKF